MDPAVRLRLLVGARACAYHPSRLLCRAPPRRRRRRAGGSHLTPSIATPSPLASVRLLDDDGSVRAQIARHRRRCRRRWIRRRSAARRLQRQALGRRAPAGAARVKTEAERRPSPSTTSIGTRGARGRRQRRGRRCPRTAATRGGATRTPPPRDAGARCAARPRAAGAAARASRPRCRRRWRRSRAAARGALATRPTPWSAGPASTRRPQLGAHAPRSRPHSPSPTWCGRSRLEQMDITIRLVVAERARPSVSSRTPPRRTRSPQSLLELLGAFKPVSPTSFSVPSSDDASLSA